MSPALSRRQLLRTGLGVGAIAVAGGAGLWQMSGPRIVGETLRSAARLPEPFTLPGAIAPTLRPERSDATTDYYRMVARRAVAEIIPGYRTEIWGYNGIFPGPTIRSRRSRTVSVTHHNELEVPTVVHLHGGHTPAESDGYPIDLIMPVSGAVEVGHMARGGVVTAGERVYTYPNDQPASTLWYHDHRMDFTAVAVWRGLAGFHLIGDEVEDSLALPTGARDLPLMVCDRAFDAAGAMNYPALDPSFLHTPGVTEKFAQGVLGDVVLVNGVPWPRYDVAAAPYRLRWLNASNARVYRLMIEGAPNYAPRFIQIGSDAGLLDKSQHLESIDMAPGERFDTIVDLSGYPIGTEITIVNDLGDGGTTRVLRLRVTATADRSNPVPDVLAPLENIDPAAAIRVREFNFREGDMPAMMHAGMNHGGAGGSSGRGWLINGLPFDPARPDTTARLGDIEIWRFHTDFNHPIHVHLNPFHVVSRNGSPPRATDRGWKDTVDVGASEVMDIAVRFTDYTGRFMLHCHNLEHEDMAMMANFQTTV